MLVLAARLLLAGVLTVAAVAKLADRAGSVSSLRGFGVPARAVAPLGVLLPLLELAIAALLIPTASARSAAVAALGLFASFAVLIAVTLARGRHPHCGCFGRLHSRPLSGVTLARTAALAALAGFAGMAGPGASASELITDPLAWLTLVVTAQAVFLVALLRRHGRLLARLDALKQEPAEVELPVGTPAPNFTLPSVFGETVSLQTLRTHGVPLLLVFADPGCGPCTTLIPEVSDWGSAHQRSVTLAVVSRGDPDMNRAQAEEHGIETFLLQEDREVAVAYGAQGTPAGVLVGQDGRIMAPLQYGADGIRALLAQALEPSPAPSRTHFEPGAEPAPLRGDKQARAAASALTLAGSATVAGAGAPHLGAATTQDEDEAFRQLRTLVDASYLRLHRGAKGIVNASRQLVRATDRRGAEFKLLAVITLMKKDARRALDEIEAVPVPDYRPGEKGARIAKSDAQATFILVGLALDRFAALPRTNGRKELEALAKVGMGYLVEAERRRRILAKRLGCKKALQDC